MPQYKIFSGGNQFQWITDGQSIKNSLTCSNSRGHQCPPGEEKENLDEAKFGAVALVEAEIN